MASTSTPATVATTSTPATVATTSTAAATIWATTVAGNVSFCKSHFFLGNQYLIKKYFFVGKFSTERERRFLLLPFIVHHF